jgi:hypothetical protein
MTEKSLRYLIVKDAEEILFPIKSMNLVCESDNVQEYVILKDTSFQVIAFESYNASIFLMENGKKSQLGFSTYIFDGRYFIMVTVPGPQK